MQQISAPEYKRLITIHAGKPKGGLRDAVMVDPDKVRRLSLSEQQFAKAAASHGTDVVRLFLYSLGNIHFMEIMYMVR